MLNTPITNDWIDHGRYWEHKASQGTDSWLKARVGRVTTSVSGAMAGRSRFKTPEEQGKIIAGMKKEVFDQRSIEAMNHGTETEPEARRWCSRHFGYNIVEKGLIVPKWDVRLGASVDGDIIGTDGIIEIKCPFKMYRPLEQYMDMVNTGWEPSKGYYDHIWKTHLSQIQHGMAVMGKKWCLYIVYCTTDGSIFTQNIPFDPEYWSKHYKTIIENYDRCVKPYLDDEYPILPGI